MTLIGKTEHAGHLRWRLAAREQLPRLGQAQLDQVGVGCQTESGFEGAGQAKTIDATGSRKVVEADVFIGVGMQIVPRDLRNQWQARIEVLTLAPVEMAGEGRQQAIERSLPDDAQIAVMSRGEGLHDRRRQARIVAQGVGKAWLTVGGCPFEQRVQFALQPVRIEIQHGVGKAILRRRMAVVDFTRLEQKHVPRRTAMTHPAAVELLDALLGHSDEKTVMPVWIVGMPTEMRTNRLDPGIDILGERDPVAFVHGRTP